MINIYLKGEDPQCVDDSIGEPIRQIWLDVSVPRDTPVEVGSFTVTLAKITGFKTGVRHEESKIAETIEDQYLGTLKKYAAEPIKKKVRREIDARIKPGISAEEFKKIDKKQLEGVIENFFTLNPQYPWCPMSVWDGLVLTGRDIPRFFELVARNDGAVERYLEGGGKLPIDNLINL